MAFEVRCPNCNKLYAAEWKMVGKRIRCRACQHVFAVSAPAEAPVHAASAGLDPDGTDLDSVGPGASHVGASDLAKTRQGMVLGQSADGATYEEAGAAERPLLRPSVPQQFPGSDIIEAWLPLALGLIAGTWTIAQTFSDNQTGRAWVPLVRILFLAGLYALLVVPITYKVVKGRFRTMKRVLPPNPFARVAMTFALPLTFGYVFWLVSGGGIASLIIGLLLGLVLMAAVFWLLFRLDPQEAANAYVAAAIAFVGSVALGAGILVGASALLNQAMIASDSARAFKESPLGSPLVWNVPPPPAPRKLKPKTDVAPDAPTIATPHPAPSNPPAPSSNPPPAQNKIASSDEGPKHPASGDETSPPPHEKTEVADATHAPLVSTPKTDDAGTESSTSPGLFDVQAEPDADAFVRKVRKTGLKCVKRIARPAEEGAYDRKMYPLTPSPLVGLFRADTRQLELCELSPAFSKASHSLAIPEAGDASSDGLLALDPLGRAVLHLWNNNGAFSVTFIPFDPSKTPPLAVTVQNPGINGSGVLSPEDALLAPQLVGALPGDRFLVRWSRPGVQVIQTYAYTIKGRLSQYEMRGDYSPDLFAVDPKGIWFATVFHEARRASLRLFNLRNPGGNSSVRVLDLPPDVPNWIDQEWVGACFSPSGDKVAVLLEHGGTATVQSWSIDGTPYKRATCDVPPGDALVGRTPGRPLAWVGGAWLVHGRTVFSGVTGQLVGALSSATVDDAHVIDDKSAYLSYMGEDGHEHVAALTLDPAAVLKAANATASGKISTGRE